MLKQVTDERITHIIDEAERFAQTLKPGAVDRLIDAEKVALADEVRRHRSAVLRWHNAERRWDHVKWNDSGQDKYDAAASLADAIAALRKLVDEAP